MNMSLFIVVVNVIEESGAACKHAVATFCEGVRCDVTTHILVIVATLTESAEL